MLVLSVSKLLVAEARGDLDLAQRGEQPAAHDVAEARTPSSRRALLFTWLSVRPAVRRASNATTSDYDSTGRTEDDEPPAPPPPAAAVSPSSPCTSCLTVRTSSATRWWTHLDVCCLGWPVPIRPCSPPQSRGDRLKALRSALRYSPASSASAASSSASGRQRDERRGARGASQKSWKFIWRIILSDLAVWSGHALYKRPFEEDDDLRAPEGELTVLEQPEVLDEMMARS